MEISNPASKEELLTAGAEFRPFGYSSDYVAVMRQKDKHILYLKKSNLYYKMD